MNKWFFITQIIGGLALGLTTMGTSLRFLFGWYHQMQMDKKFISEFRQNHLPFIYKVLEAIADKLGVEAEFPRL